MLTTVANVEVNLGATEGEPDENTGDIRKKFVDLF